MSSEVVIMNAKKKYGFIKKTKREKINAIVIKKFFRAIKRHTLSNKPSKKNVSLMFPLSHKNDYANVPF